ncbi:MAG: restriction endonuclease subunit S, partial [Cetobacterium sp.]
MVQFILDNFDTIFRNEKSFQTFDKMILDLAVRGKLVPQIEDEEPASKLLQKIKEEKERLISEKVIKKEKLLLPITEDEKQFNIPNSWEWVRLGNVINLNMGQSPKGDCVTENKDGIGLIGGPADMLNTDVNITRYTKKPTKICKYGDLILTVRATLGKTIFSNGEYCLGRGVAGISSNFVNLNFIQLVLNNKKTYFYEIGKGSTFLQISKVDIENLNLALPPLEEQERIVEKVEKLQELSKKFKEIYNSNEKTRANLKKAILEEVEKSDTNNELLISLEK